MAKRTLAQIAKKQGITIDQLNDAKSHGINVWNDAELAEWASSRRHRIAPGAKINDPVAASAQSLEEMELAIRQATDIDTVKILKEKVIALKGIVAVQQETRELVPAGEVREEITRAVSAARGELLKLSADLPPKLEGLQAAKMQPVIRAAIIETLTRLSDETGELYQ